MVKISDKARNMLLRQGAADGFVAARHPYIGIEFFHGLYEFS